MRIDVCISIDVRCALASSATSSLHRSPLRLTLVVVLGPKGRGGKPKGN